MLTAIITAVFVVSIVVSVILAVILLDAQHPTPSRIALASYLISTAVWSGIALAGAGGHVGNSQVLVAWTLPVVAMVVASAVAFSLALPRPTWRPGWSTLSLLALHPAIMVTVAAIPSAHSLVVVETSDGGAAYGWLFWVHAAYSYGAMSFALFRVVFLPSAPTPARRWSSVATLIVWLLPVAANVFTVMSEGAAGPDLTPLAFLVTALLVAMAVFRDGLADVVPVARLRVFESLTDAVVVLSNSGRLVDANRTALQGLDQLGVRAPTMGSVLAEGPRVLRDALAGEGPRDVKFREGTRVMDVSRSPLLDHKGRTIGTLVHAKDVTESVMRTRELERLADALAAEVRINKALRSELADQVIRDHATGLHNRRYVLDRLPGIVTRCHRDAVPLAVVMLDIDHFKSINDTYGHAVGDRALVAVAESMSRTVKEGLVARFGGEEFLLVLADHDEAQATAVAERVREACQRVKVAARGAKITITVSAGVAVAYPPNIDAHRLIDAADEAMYAAKRGGRNATGRASHAQV